MIDRNDVRCTAFHEAGHAVAAAVFAIPFERVFIVRTVHASLPPVDKLLGQVVRNFQKSELAGKGEEEVLRHVIQAFAGPYGETLASENLSLIMPVDDPDVIDAWSCLRFAFCEFTIDDGNATFSQAELQRNKPRMEGLFQSGRRDAVRFVQQHRKEITCVAEALLRDVELTYDQVIELCLSDTPSPHADHLPSS